MFLAGIQKNTLDTGLRRYDQGDLDTHLCGVVLRRSRHHGANRPGEGLLAWVLHNADAALRHFALINGSIPSRISSATIPRFFISSMVNSTNTPVALVHN